MKSIQEFVAVKKEVDQMDDAEKHATLIIKNSELRKLLQ